MFILILSALWIIVYIEHGLWSNGCAYIMVVIHVSALFVVLSVESLRHSMKATSLRPSDRAYNKTKMLSSRKVEIENVEATQPDAWNHSGSSISIASITNPVICRRVEDLPRKALPIGVLHSIEPLFSHYLRELVCAHRAAWKMTLSQPGSQIGNRLQLQL